MLKVTIDLVACNGSGVCARVLPDVFRLVDDGEGSIAEVIPGAEASDIALLDAARYCPRTAIILEEADGTVVYPHG